MKFIDLTTKYKVDKEKLKIGISVSIIILISAISVVAIKTLINTQEEQAKAKENAQLVALLESTKDIVDENATETSADIEITSEGTTITETLEASEAPETSETTSGESPAESISELTETQAETQNEVTSATTTAVATSTPAPTPTPSYSETSLSKQVYATCKLNVRSGPGTSYDAVKQIERGSAIDVIGVTDSGWYHTYNGNWVSKDLCQDTPPATSTPVPQQTVPTSTKAPASTTAATTASTTAATAAATQAPSSNGMTLYGSCTITFYGPQPTGNGNYSTTTATGTTCTEGVTCAADWGIFPAGTVIYVENDPLGGDGYYTVEDKGSGVKGAHIDIYASDGESSAHSTTTRNVYIVN